VVTGGVFEPVTPPPHEARQVTADSTAKKMPGKTPEPTAVLFDMFVSSKKQNHSKTELEGNCPTLQNSQPK
jgi:hypothetical protein